MNVLGLRCSSSDYSYVILQGTKAIPILADNGVNVFPKNYSEHFLLRWMFQEMEDIYNKGPFDAVVLKGPEPMAPRNKAYTRRIEIEAICMLRAAEAGIKNVQRKVNVSIAKHLGQKGKARYIKQIDTSIINGYDALSKKQKEAALAAWSELQ